MSERGSATRLIAGLALAGVSAIAAVVSYLHALDVVKSVGAAGPVVYLIPFLADLVILGASASILDCRGRGLHVPVLTWASFGFGVGVTLAMNIAAGLGHGRAGALVAGWPAVAFILALESLAGMVRRGRPKPGERVVPPPCTHLVPATASEAEKVVAALRHGKDCQGRAPSFRELERQLGVPRARVSLHVKASLNGDGSHGA